MIDHPLQGRRMLHRRKVEQKTFYQKYTMQDIIGRVNAIEIHARI